MKKINLINKRFGRLVVIKKAPNVGKKTCWECKCDCGNTTYSLTTNLVSGKSQSCGCLKNEKLIQRSTTHNQRHTKLYEVWKSIKQRCYNLKSKPYKNYGGRGISVSSKWINSFQSFYDWAVLNGYQEGLTIDRVDNNGNYEPSNCRWVTNSVQQNNKRTNRYLLIDNQKKSLSEWCKIYNISPHLVKSRLNRGWDALKALTTPKMF